jgi:predicted glycosyltransferase
MAIIVGTNEVAIANAKIAKALAKSVIKSKIVKENQHTCCGCYKENSTDSRCCGICYYCCPAKHIDKEIIH